MLGKGSAVRNYRIITQMKQGVQGFVYLVEEQETHVQLVLKSVVVEEQKKPEFEKMIANWKILCKSKAKDFIVSYVDHFQENGSSVIIMEYCSGGDMETLIEKRKLENEKFSEEEVLKVLVEGMSALKEMHLLSFLHRDVKAGNILIGTDGKFKMSDFNTSKILEESRGTTTMAVGTLEYTAPEIYNSEQYSYPVDIFSFGAVLYQMMVGRTPFANERGVVMRNLVVGKYDPISATLGYSTPLVNFVHSCLALDPSARPTAAEALTLPFVVQAQTDARIRALEARCVAAEREAREAKKEVQKLKERMDAAEKEKEAVEAKSKAQQAVGKTGTSLSAALPPTPPTLVPVPVPVSALHSSTNHLDIVSGWLGNSKRFVPLYKASRDGFTVRAFNERCDLKGPTVSVITSAEGWVFGGYAAVSFNSRVGGFIADKSLQSFVFCLKSPHNTHTPPTKFSLRKECKTKAVWCGDLYGPVFGYAIECHDNSNINNGNGSCFSLHGGHYSNPAADSTVFGREYRFTAQDIEVYQVL